MYTPGKIIYFDPFFFKEGGSKPKYFLVLKVIDDNVILASLPSSIEHLPAGMEIKHGCLEIPSACISCYIFEAKKPITTNGWFFPRNTFLYACWLDDYHIPKLMEMYSIEKVEYEIIGEITKDELQNVIKCFAVSNTIKRRYKKILAA